LADEPTGNLDFRTGEMIMNLLDDLHRRHQLTSIYVTHNSSLAARCDRVLHLEQGVLAEASHSPIPGESGCADGSASIPSFVEGSGSDGHIIEGRNYV
jgi:ABC-type lipoprotein export system ATPase subunit